MKLWRLYGEVGYPLRSASLDSLESHLKFARNPNVDHGDVAKMIAGNRSQVG